MQSGIGYTPTESNISSRREALQRLFGHSAEKLQQVPDAIAWCKYLEECFKPLLKDEYAAMWTSMGLARPKATSECWTWFSTVVKAIVEVADAGASIEDVWQATILPCAAQSAVAHSITEKDKQACLVPVFAVLCWGSMTLSPRLLWPGCAAKPGLAVQHLTTSPALKMEFVERPISAVFRHLHRPRVAGRWRPRIGFTTAVDCTVLYVASLNFASLKIVGKVRLKWVDDMNSHLDFDSASRMLSIFRHPSFCALITMRDDGVVILDESVHAIPTNTHWMH
jgi:hypothetical protein